METIIGHVDVSEIKRCYINLKAPFRIKCPTCKRMLHHDMDSDYFGYPEIKEPTTLSIYCDDCEEYIEVPMIIDSVVMTIKYEPEKAKVE
jgi:hypothetical protein